LSTSPALGLTLKWVLIVFFSEPYYKTFCCGNCSKLECLSIATTASKVCLLQTRLAPTYFLAPTLRVSSCYKKYVEVAASDKRTSLLCLL
jgi:hypothetical protein